MSARNSLKHGLLSREVLVPGDDEERFQQLRRRLWAALGPATALEALIAERVVAAAWRLRRVLEIEREMLVEDLEERLRIWHMLYEENRQKPTLGQAVGHDLKGDDGLGKLIRYEAHLERGLYRALHELQRLQAMRAGATVPPPVALDVSVDVASDAAEGLT